MIRGLTRFALVATLFAAAACEPSGPTSTDAHIIAPGFAGAGVGITNAKSDLPYTIGDLVICLDRPGNAVIDRIELTDVTGDLHLDAFAVVPNVMEQGRPGFADGNRTLTEQGLDIKHVVMTRQCPDFDHATPDPLRDPQSVALVLQYSKSGIATAATKGITLHYTSGGTSYTLSLPWSAALCGVGDYQPLCSRSTP